MFSKFRMGERRVEVETNPTHLCPDCSTALGRAGVDVVIKQQLGVCNLQLLVCIQTVFQALQPSKDDQQMSARIRKRKLASLPID